MFLFCPLVRTLGDSALVQGTPGFSTSSGFVSTLPLSPVILRPSGEYSHGEVEVLFTYKAVELALFFFSPGFSAFFLLVLKASRSWRPLMDFLSLNSSVLMSHFRMESPHSVLRLGCFPSTSRMCISRFVFIQTIASFLRFVVVGMSRGSRSVLRSLLDA